MLIPVKRKRDRGGAPYRKKPYWKKKKKGMRRRPIDWRQGGRAPPAEN
jgi:hypothetical protein